jgi:hypothetical protein
MALPSLAYVGFTGATGSNAAAQQISNFSYHYGSTIYGNPLVLNAGTTSTIEVGATPTATAISMGSLTVGAGAPSGLNVAPDSNTVAANQAYTLALGSVSLAGSVTLGVANNGSGAGSLMLGSLDDGGAARAVSFAGPGNLTLNSPAISLVAGTQFIVRRKPRTPEPVMSDHSMFIGIDDGAGFQLLHGRKRLLDARLHRVEEIIRKPHSADID